MRRIVVLAGFILVLALAVAGTALAGAGNSFEAELAGKNEVPSVDTAAKGEAEFEFRAATIEYSLEAEDIDGVVAGHIHLGDVGVNGPVVADLITPQACEFGEDEVRCEGVIRRADLQGPLAGRPLGRLLREMRAGNTYTNVHTAEFPGGEIRGQIERD